jgi:hypothetical protein
MEEARAKIASQEIAAINLKKRFLNNRPRDQIAVKVPIIAIAIPKGGAKWCKKTAAAPVAKPTTRETSNFI